MSWFDNTETMKSFKKYNITNEDVIAKKKTRMKEIWATIDKYKKEHKDEKELEPLFKELDNLYDLFDE